MDIQNIGYKEIAKIIYPHYFEMEVERRVKALEFLVCGDFESLRDIAHYCNSKSTTIELNSTLVSDVIEELQKLKLPKYSDKPYLATIFNTEDEFFNEDDATICIFYRTYSVVGEEKCKSLAKHWSESAAWKLKHQPNSKDGKAAMKLLQQYI